MALRSRPSFWALIVAQFFGAFNDNAFKAILLLLAFSSFEESRATIAITATALFFLPFVLFSTHAGRIADRFSKRSVIVSMKVFELGIMLAATASLLWGGIYALVGVLFLLAVQSTIFSPVKYGILPEILPPEDLPRANGLLELMTFSAIISGTFTSTLLFNSFRDELALLGGGLVVLSLVGISASLAIAPVAAAAPERRLAWNPLPEMLEAFRAVSSTRTLRLTAAGIAFFWALASLLDLSILFYAAEFAFDEVAARERAVGIMKVLLAVGIGLGSVVAGYLSHNKPELGLVPVGSLGMGILVIALGFSTSSYGLALVLLGLLGVAGGFFIVPLNVLLQQEAPRDAKGRVLGGTNLLTFSASFLSLGILYVCLVQMEFEASQAFFVLGGLAVAATAYVFWILPAAFFRFLFWFVVNIVYRVRVHGRANLPVKGAALLVSNHVSFVDGLLVLASTHRPIRFLVYAPFTRLPGLGWLARTLNVIPVANDEGPRSIIASLKEASRALERGELVCIFAEGEISRTGQLLPFRGGVEKILRGASAPVVPVYLDRVWGSIFSFMGRKFLRKIPRRIPYPVTVTFGEPLPPETPVSEIRQRVQELGSEAFALRKQDGRPLAETLLRYCRRRPFGLAIVDSMGARVSRGKLLVGTLAMARRFAAEFADEPMVGILIPPSVGTAVSNVAASFLGKPVVNFNYTVGDEVLRSAASQCGIRKVLTSRQFLDKFDVEVPGEPVYLEDLRQDIGAADRALAALAAWLLPMPLLRRFVGARDAGPDDIVTVIFSSGSTGEPKGVQLSNFNILSNVQAIAQGFDFEARDRLLGVLPFFHSTGYTVTLWTPLLSGMAVVYHPNPLDARTVGYLCRRHACTTLVATPTFLQGYTRRCTPGDFGSLRYVVVGAEKLSDVVRQGFLDKFGVEPMEGYGATECSPLVSVNVPDYRGPGVRQVGTKRGIGHPLPGVSVRIVDPETFEPRPTGEEGLLLVKGPNVMQGYLGKEELTADVLRDGWYVTGDIAAMDEDGFLTLTDRLARFAKIAGEMVPHLKVEEALNNLLDSSEKRLVVTSIPDEKKGERLAVVHCLNEKELADVISRLEETKLPNLWMPRSDSFVSVDAIPVLGTGKIDLRRVRELARDKLSASPAK